MEKSRSDGRLIHIFNMSHSHEGNTSRFVWKQMLLLFIRDPHCKMSLLPTEMTKLHRQKHRWMHRFHGQTSFSCESQKPLTGFEQDDQTWGHLFLWLYIYPSLFSYVS